MGETMLGDTFGGVESVYADENADFKERNEGEELEVALDICIGGAEEELDSD